jgi:hypothetical protein
MGFRLRKVVKAKPQKKLKDTTWRVIAYEGERGI